jgi:hypothetical protein
MTARPEATYHRGLIEAWASYADPESGQARPRNIEIPPSVPQSARPSAKWAVPLTNLRREVPFLLVASDGAIGRGL